MLGHIGNYVTAKNSAYLLKILQKTREKLPNAKLLLIGDGPDRLAVEAQAKEMRLFEHMQFWEFVTMYRRFCRRWTHFYYRHFSRGYLFLQSKHKLQA